MDLVFVPLSLPSRASLSGLWSGRWLALVISSPSGKISGPSKYLSGLQVAPVSWRSPWTRSSRCHGPSWCRGGVRCSTPSGRPPTGEFLHLHVQPIVVRSTFPLRSQSLMSPAARSGGPSGGVTAAGGTCEWASPSANDAFLGLRTCRCSVASHSQGPAYQDLAVLFHAQQGH